MNSEHVASVHWERRDGESFIDVIPVDLVVLGGLVRGVAEQPDARGLHQWPLRQYLLTHCRASRGGETPIDPTALASTARMQ